MRLAVVGGLIALGTSVLGAVPATMAAPGEVEGAAVVTALYQMNEPAGATVMADTSGNGLNGAVDPRGVQTGGTYAGAVGYNWVYRSPTAPPATPERVVQVPDNINLEPGNEAFTLEFRLRFTNKFGNVIQKGQATTSGGQWKVQLPGGYPSCLFNGSKRRVATKSTIRIDDGAWHVVSCVFDQTGVTLLIDGVRRGRKNGAAGTVNNTFPMTIGGKISCDQVKVTCDYYTGQVDYVKITKGS